MIRSSVYEDKPECIRQLPSVRGGLEQDLGEEGVQICFLAYQYRSHG